MSRTRRSHPFTKRVREWDCRQRLFNGGWPRRRSLKESVLEKGYELDVGDFFLFLLSRLYIVIDDTVCEIDFIFETVLRMGTHDALLHLLGDVAFVFWN
jgi:hypothetical protein